MISPADAVSPEVKRAIPAEGPGYLPALDGLRGLAILLVLLHHVLRIQPKVEGLFGALFHRVASVGWVGVDLFFVLSGFLITGILLESRHQPKYFKNFFVRRALRIFPLYFGFLALVLWVFPLLFWKHPEWAETFRQQKVWYFAYLVNYAMPLVWETWPPYSLVHLWSLCVEQHFYLLWPFVVLWLSPRKLSVLCLAILAAGPLLRGGTLLLDQTLDWQMPSGRTRLNLANYVFSPFRLDALAIGSYVRVLLGMSREKGIRKALLVSAGLLGGIWLLGRGTLEGTAPLVQVFGYGLVAVFFGALLAEVVRARPAQQLPRLLSRGPLMVLGKYSYAVYLFHLPLQSYLLGYVYPAFGLPLGEGRPLSRILHLLVLTGLSLLLARVSWSLWERPFLRLKRYFR